MLMRVVMAMVTMTMMMTTIMINMFRAPCFCMYSSYTERERNRGPTHTVGQLGASLTHESGVDDGPRDWSALEAAALNSLRLLIACQRIFG